MEKSVSSQEEWDVFISYASEDKAFVRPLAEALRAEHLTVWFDEFTLTVGASLRRSIDEGLIRCKKAVVVISPAYLQKEWPKRELDALVARESSGSQLMLPIWHDVSAEEVLAKLPLLADRYAIFASDGLEKVVFHLLRALGRASQSDESRLHTDQTLTEPVAIGVRANSWRAPSLWSRASGILLEHAKRRLDYQIHLALSRASICLDRKVPYVFGGKTPDGLDCSGLVTHCFPRVLPDGVEKQVERLNQWLFEGPDLQLVEPGDLVFFSESAAIRLSHIALVEARISDCEFSLLHASEGLGEVSRDIWNVDKNSFRATYVARYAAKIRPFLFRLFLEDEINRELTNANS